MMKIKRSLILSLFLLCISTLAFAQSWPVVTNECKPGTRWWWLGSAVNAADLKWNLDQYAWAGIGTVEITPLYGVKGNEKNELSFLSSPWMNALKKTEDICADNSIEVDMNCGTGWPFGGPQVKINEAACKVVHREWDIDGGKHVKVNVAPAVRMQPYTYLNRLMAYSADGKVVDVTSKVKDSLYVGKLAKGQWRLMAVYVSRTLQKVKRAAPGGEGYVIDHFDSLAVCHYLQRFDDAFRGGTAAWPHTFFNDSYEVYGADWTPGLFEAFLRQRGYKLEEHLPELFGYKSDGGKTLADYRETLSELLIKNFTTQWTTWAHGHGAITRNQAHGSPANLIDTYAAVDIPEIEGFGLTNFHIKGLREDSGFTRKNYSDLSMLKYASSAAHITGKKWTSSETFTWLTEHFRTSLSQCKPDLDLMFTAGVNHVFFHGSCYSPKDDAWPGWKFYASIDMSPTNTFWRDAPDFMDYITRCQSFLQMGEPDNDYLVYLPVHHMWHRQTGQSMLMMFDINSMERKAPEFIRSVLAIDSMGFDCDYISDKYLLSTTCKEGMPVTSAGVRYKAILVPDSAYMPEALKEHLRTLVSQGCRVTYGEKCLAAKPEVMKSLYHLKAVRRRNASGYHYFIANLTPNEVDAYIPLAVDFKWAMIFNPMTGDKYQADVSDGKVRLHLRSGESIILQTFNYKQGYLQPQNTSRLLYASHPKTIHSGWTFSFIDVSPAITKKYVIDTVRTWEGLDDLTAIAMGTGSYTTTFVMSEDEMKSCDDFCLDLGDVRESACVWLNGDYIGRAWAVPYILNCKHAVKAGINKLRIDVTNLPANHIAVMDRKQIPWRKFKEINVVDLNYSNRHYENWAPVPSGLHSPVRIFQLRRDSTVSPSSVLTQARVVNEWLMKKYPHPGEPTHVGKTRPSNLWTRGVYYEGLSSLCEIAPDNRYYDYTDQWGQAHQWKPRDGEETLDADNQCCCQSYLDRFEQTHDSAMVLPTIRNIQHQMSKGQHNKWTWIDAIQMSMPVYAKLYKMTKDRHYLNFAVNSYLCSRDSIAGGLFSVKDGLWWRDKNFTPPYAESDGKPCYWSRGNGWVYAALVRVMSQLSPEDRYYKILAKDFMAMSKAILACQREDGFWNVSLLSPVTFGGKETTGTSLFLYGLSWGLRQGLLTGKRYRDAADKAWRGISQDAIHPETGFLGYMQGTGKEPKDGQPVEYDTAIDFPDFGVGCFLLGASEYYKWLEQVSINHAYER